MTTQGFHGLTVADLDTIDRQIVRLLQQDGRRSVSDIAKEVGLSHAGTRQRVHRLLAHRIVQIAAITNPRTHGYGSSGALGIKTTGDPWSVADKLDAIDEVYYVVIANGSFDLFVELMGRDLLHLTRLIGEIRRIEGVAALETFTFVELTKWSYAPAFLTDDDVDEPVDRPMAP